MEELVHAGLPNQVLGSATVFFSQFCLLLFPGFFRLFLFLTPSAISLFVSPFKTGKKGKKYPQNIYRGKRDNLITSLPWSGTTAPSPPPLPPPPPSATSISELRRSLSQLGGRLEGRGPDNFEKKYKKTHNFVSKICAKPSAAG